MGCDGFLDADQPPCFLMYCYRCGRPVVARPNLPSGGHADCLETRHDDKEVLRVNVEIEGYEPR